MAITLFSKMHVKTRILQLGLTDIIVVWIHALHVVSLRAVYWQRHEGAVEFYVCFGGKY